MQTSPDAIDTLDKIAHRPAAKSSLGMFELDLFAILVPPMCGFSEMLSQMMTSLKCYLK
jgi:hypothetical protein